jgi:hypothetical protein
LRVILVCYTFGESGNVVSEWLKDKILGLEELGHSLTVVTSTTTSVESNPTRKVIRIPSISLKDFRSEFEYMKTTHVLSRFPSRIILFLSWLQAHTAGWLLDRVMEKLTGTHSDGRWSWFFYAAPAVVLETLRHKGSVILSTGGPSVAHLVALVAGRVSGRKFVCEAQDPLIGSQMVLSPFSYKALRILEANIAKFSNKLVFVTKKAAESATKRNPGSSDGIVAIYPGAYDYGIRAKGSEGSHKGSGQLTLAHVGHLYGSRNLDLLFEAIDQLVAEKEITSGFFQVWSLGPAYVQSRSKYLDRDDYRESSLSTRVDSLNQASTADFLLLVQHADSRSEETIPYKTYDYLNLGIPIFGLLNNSELLELLDGRGISASATDLQVTKAALKQLAERIELGRLDKPSLASPVDFHDQLRRLLQLE